MPDSAEANAPVTDLRRREVRVGGSHDTRELLRNARRQAQERGFDQFPIVDVDAHHYETESWAEISEFIEDPIVRRQNDAGGVGGLTGSRTSMLPQSLGNQDLSGRIPRYRLRGLERWEDDGDQRDSVLLKRAMAMLGIDVQVVFPTPMLNLGLHPQTEVEVALSRAYARWITERVLAGEPSLRTMLYLPLNDPAAALAIVEEFAGRPGVVGFMVTATRYRPVHHNDYAPLYRAIEQSGLPLGFHAGYNWQGDRSMEMLNRFISVHALGFVWHNLVHLTNWVINGMPERFPDLDVIWIESGLAWLPFLMQRLDHEFVMRPSEAPLLQRRPSEYIRGMYFTSQPLEVTDLGALEVTFRMIDAENRLLYSSDYPHWDFDVPSRIYDLPFLDERSKRNILGGNALRLFGAEALGPHAA
jgi:predicted TIM-barrel fold metal-dependent hydrolase